MIHILLLYIGVGVRSSQAASSCGSISRAASASYRQQLPHSLSSSIALSPSRLQPPPDSSENFSMSFSFQQTASQPSRASPEASYSSAAASGIPAASTCFLPPNSTMNMLNLEQPDGMPPYLQILTSY